MPVVNKQLITHHTPENLHSLVSDIRRYPEFIRWIKSLRVSEERIDTHKIDSLGEALVGFKGFTETFATRVTANSVNHTVSVKLVRGPFRHLRNEWKFSKLDSSQTRIDFHIDYAFSNPVLALLARSNADMAIKRIMEAFLGEADNRYGPPVSAQQV